MRAKASQLRAEIANTGTEFAKWNTLFNEGQFANASDALKNNILQVAAEVDTLAALREKTNEEANTRASARQELDAIAEQTRAVRRGFMARDAVAQAYLNAEIQRLRRLVEQSALVGAERKRVEANVQAHIASLREQTARETESQVDTMFRHWSGATRRLHDATSTWLQDQTDGLPAFAVTGKLKFAAFAQSFRSK